MHRAFLMRALASLLFLSALLYLFIDHRNRLTQLQLELPRIAKEIERLEQEKSQLTFQVEEFEHPLHLLELARRPEYAHLISPPLHEILILPKEEQ